MPSLSRGPDGRRRCWWGATSPDYVRYHDEEWGRPVTDERGLYERMVLEGFQSGLSWLTILRKRENFRAAFADFDIETVARFGKRDVNRLLKDAGIVRHRGKIEAAINNAKAAAAMHEQGESLAELVWSHAPTGPPPRAARARGPAGDDARVDGAREGAEEARLSLRRADHRLRDDAGLRGRERPPGGLLRPRRGSARARGAPLSSVGGWMSALSPSA